MPQQSSNQQYPTTARRVRFNAAWKNEDLSPWVVTVNNDDTRLTDETIERNRWMLECFVEALEQTVDADGVCDSPAAHVLLKKQLCRGVYRTQAGYANISKLWRRAHFPAVAEVPSIPSAHIDLQSRLVVLALANSMTGFDPQFATFAEAYRWALTSLSTPPRVAQAGVDVARPEGA